MLTVGMDSMMITSVRLFACLSLIAAAGCRTYNGTIDCSPACASGFHCDTGSGSCVPDSNVDMAVAGPADIAVSACDPPCALPLRCNAQRRCVPCLTDEHCPIGNICKTTNFGTICTPGCGDDSRCPMGSKCCNSACVSVQSDAL